MARNYGTGAYGGGNYSGMTVGSAAAGAGTLVAAGQAAVPGWQGRVAGAPQAFGLMGDLARLAADFLSPSGARSLELAGGGAAAIWKAVAGAGSGGGLLDCQATALTAGFAVGGDTGVGRLIGGDLALRHGNLWGRPAGGGNDWARAPLSAASWRGADRGSANWIASQGNEQ